MSSLTIRSIARMTRSTRRASPSRIISAKVTGTICRDRPNLSFNQPQCYALRLSRSPSHGASITTRVAHATEVEIASVNLKCGQSFNAMKSRPRIWNSIISTDPIGPGPTSQQRVAPRTPTSPPNTDL